MEIEDALEKLPKGEEAYRQAYDEAMEKRIKGQKPGFANLALQAISWITFAKRPLSTSELQHALAVTDGASTLDSRNLRQIGLIISVCAGLVAVDAESDIIRLVHYTTQEYFEQTGRTWFPHAQTDITKICVTYLSFDAFKTGSSPTDEDFSARIQSNVLYNYAARNWGHHACKSSIEGEKLILDLLESTTKVSACSQAMIYNKYIWGGETQMSGVHLAAYFGLVTSMSALLERLHDINSKDKDGQTPLLWATENGHEAVVRLLLDKGADVESKDKYGQTPLSRAAMNGREAVVRLLLDKGADVESKDDVYGQTPLLWAAENGHEAVVRLLLDRGADVESKDKYRQTPLFCAAEYGHEAVVRLLLDKGADVESKDDEYGQTPLFWAAEYGHEAVVRLLLDRGADVESKVGHHGQTPLLWAAENGHEAVVRLLLDKGTDAESKDEYGQTPLLWAAAKGHEAVVRLLLDKGADVEPKVGDHGQTPLFWAATNGHEAVVRLLLDKGADAESKDEDGQTPLFWAAENGHEAVVRLLQGLNGATPLS
jgi:ankyrin repeat protein